MNIKKNKQKKELVLQMIKEMAETTRNFENIPDIKKDIITAKFILKGFLKEAFEFEPIIRFVDDRLLQSKGQSIAFWASLVKIIRKYFDEVKKIDRF